MKILLTGGAGYIGTHTAVELLNKGYDIVIADNFYNSKPEAVERVRKITGKDFSFYETDMTDKKAVENIFSNEDIDTVIHFAGLKAVGVSVEKPVEYYREYSGYISGSTSEGFGLSLMEAVGSGLPLIGLDVPYGNQTFIENGKNGSVEKQSLSRYRL